MALDRTAYPQGVSLGDAPTMMGLSGDSGAPTARPRGEEQEALALERGQTAGRYVVIETLGSGGMGVVYAAYAARRGQFLGIIEDFGWAIAGFPTRAGPA